MKIKIIDINNLDENCENKYKRKKSKNDMLKDDNSNNKNDKELFIIKDKIFTDENLGNFKNDEAKTRNKSQSRSKEKRSQSNKNRNILGPSNLKENIENKNNMNEGKDIKNKNNLNKKINIDIYLINKFFKFINLKNYPYTMPIAKKLKIIFQLFLENRKQHVLYLRSNNIYEDEDTQLCQESHAAYKIKENKPKEKFKNKYYYERFQKRIINCLENEMTFKPENLNTSGNNSKNNIVLSNKIRKVYKYRNLAIKYSYYIMAPDLKT